MRKIYSLMLIAAGLLIGTSLQAATHPVDTKPALDAAIQAIVANGAAEEGDVINITANITLDATTNYCIFYGNANYGHKLTINLNDHKISQPYNATQTPIFTLYNGQMEINGPGTIESASGKVIAMYGYGKNGIDNVGTQPADYNVLTINKDVTVQLAATKIPMTGAAASNNYEYIERVLYVDQTGDVPGSNPKYSAANAARGVVINLNGCAILADPLNNGHRCIQTSGNLSNAEGNVPVINATNVMFTAGSGIFLKNGNKEEGATALYGGGVAKWNLTNCTVEGCIAIYTKAGSWNIQNCSIHSNSTAEYTPAVFADAGTNGGLGCAIIMDNNSNYGKLDGIKIINTTVVADNGIAINETVTKGDDNVKYVTIESGTFVGKVDALQTTAALQQKMKDEGQITGGDWRGTDVSVFLSTGYTTLDFFDSDNNKFQVVVKIPANNWQNTIAGSGADDFVYVKTGNEDVVTDNKVAFLRIAAGKTVTVKDGFTLDAGTLMVEGTVGNEGKIIVEAGGRLIVSGDQGAYTFNEKSLVIKTQENKPGILLINPAVYVNTTPKATVEYISNSWRNNASDKVNQFCGMPMVGGHITTITADPADYRTQLDVWRGSEWDRIGIMEGSDASTLDFGKFDVPFGFYSILSTNTESDNIHIKYTMTGNLFGNTSPVISMHKGYVTLSNGYTGAISTQSLFDVLMTLANKNVEGNVYTYEQNGTGLDWTANNQLRLGEAINPMAPFMLRNQGTTGTQLNLNYKDLVWNPAMRIASAPARRISNDMSKATIRVNGNGMTNIVTLAESAQFTTGYDNGFDAEKYMGEKMNLYVMDEKPMDIFATDNINNTYVGFEVEKAGTYTLSFEDLQGQTMTLVDLVNGSQIDMVEGATYDFEAEANEANDYRFQVIRHNTATNLQNAHVDANVMKTLQNGRLMIIKNGRRFDAMGVNVK